MKSKVYLIESATGKKIRIKKTFKVGRAQGDRTYPDDGRMSRDHCEFHLNENELYVIDLKSKNGTLVNDQAIKPEAPILIFHEDVVTIGDQVFVLDAPDFKRVAGNNENTHANSGQTKTLIGDQTNLSRTEILPSKVFTSDQFNSPNFNSEQSGSIDPSFGTSLDQSLKIENALPSNPLISSYEREKTTIEHQGKLENNPSNNNHQIQKNVNSHVSPKLNRNKPPTPQLKTDEQLIYVRSKKPKLWKTLVLSLVFWMPLPLLLLLNQWLLIILKQLNPLEVLALELIIFIPSILVTFWTQQVLSRIGWSKNKNSLITYIISVLAISSIQLAGLFLFYNITNVEKRIFELKVTEFCIVQPNPEKCGELIFKCSDCLANIEKQKKEIFLNTIYPTIKYIADGNSKENRSDSNRNISSENADKK